MLSAHALREARAVRRGWKVTQGDESRREQDTPSRDSPLNLPIASVAGWRVAAVAGDEKQITAVDALDASGRSLQRLSGTGLWA